jgi:CRISPR-associated exonuclease Cas4
MEHTSEHVLEGKMIESESFKRRSEKNKQIQLGSIKIDYIDKDKKIIYETKKSSKNLEVSIMQIKYYLYIINDIEWKGVIEIPKEKKES